MKTLLFKRLPVALVALVAIVNPALAGETKEYPKMLQEPLVIPNGQTLVFVRDKHNVTAEFTSPGKKSDEKEFNDATFSLGDVDIVAVFYQDLDLGGQREVVVMYRDAAGKPHMRAWGSTYNEIQPLTRFTPTLESISPQLKPFTVASARKAIAQLPPQNYLSAKIPDELPDPLFTEVLTSPEKYHPLFQGYFNDNYNKVESLEDAAGYYLTFPEKYIERENDKGEKAKYFLTMEYTNSGTCGRDEYAFAISGLYYSRGTATGKPDKEGPAVYLNLQNCTLQKNGAGEYKNNLMEGKWSWDGEYPQNGTFHLGKREGLWHEFSGNGIWREGKYHNDVAVGLWQGFSQSNEVVMIENYDNAGVYDGFWQKKTQLDDERWVIDEQGNYVKGKKEGDWQEQMNYQPRYSHYSHGLFDGEIRETTLDGKDISRKHYVHGVLQGEAKSWFDNGQLKSIAIYENGRKQGAEYLFQKDGRLENVQTWKAPDKDTVEICAGISQSACDDKVEKMPASLRNGEWSAWEDGILTHLENWCDDKQCGKEYRFSKSGLLLDKKVWKNGESVEEAHYELAGDRRQMTNLTYHSVKAGNRSSVTKYHHFTDNIYLFHFECPGPTERCGTEYAWYKSGEMAQTTQYIEGRLITLSRWLATGDMSWQIAKATEDKFAERYFLHGKILRQTLRSAQSENRDGRVILSTNSSDAGVTSYYDEDANEVTRQQQQEKWGGELKKPSRDRPFVGMSR